MGRKLAVLLLLLTSWVLGAQKMTLEDIWAKPLPWKYFTGVEMLPGHRAVKGEFQHGSYRINVYDMSTWKVEKTLFDSRNFDDIRYVYDFTLSPDEQKMLLSAERHPIYRHSTADKYYVYDVSSKKTFLLDRSFVQIPGFSPDGQRVVYVKDNNLYGLDLNDFSVTQITSDGEKNRMINGKTDWVYEEEFGFVRAYAFSKSGRYLAYLKFDESRVPEFTMMEYDDALYPKPVRFKYPKAGEPNSKVSLHIYDFATQKTRDIDLGDYEYIPRLKQGFGDDEFVAMTFNRLQNDLKVYRVDAVTGNAGLLIRRTDKRYIDLEATDNFTYMSGGKILWSSEKDGYNHVYLYDNDGQNERQITRGKWEVTHFYGYNPKTREIYFQATIPGSIHRAVYKQKIKGGKPVLLSPGKGTSSADFTRDFQYFILTYTNVETPPQVSVIRTADKQKTAVISDNKPMREWLKSHGFVAKSFTRFPSADPSVELNGWMMLPPEFDKSKKYPVLIYGYNGPGVQTVRDAFGWHNDLYHAMLAQNGYIVVSVDTRGTGGRGAEFKKATYKRLGRLETDDLRAVGEYLASLPYVDKQRIGVWGWSFGGFMAANAILQNGDIFRAAIAVAPVTDWRFYDTVYTERYLQTPQENPDGYDLNSPLTYADHLQGKFLLVHGTADDNVHVQNSFRLARKLQEAGKPFQMMIYPDKNHGIYGGKTRYQLYRIMFDFLENNLKK